MADARLDTSRTFGTNLLVVALDEAAAVAACAAGCAVVRFGGGKGKDAIYEAKYGTLHLLLSLKRDATFREMDVWHLRDPAAGTKEADVVFSVHQDNPYNINAGWIHARGRGWMDGAPLRGPREIFEAAPPGLRPAGPELHGVRVVGADECDARRRRRAGSHPAAVDDAAGARDARDHRPRRPRGPRPALRHGLCINQIVEARLRHCRIMTSTPSTRPPARWRGGVVSYRSIQSSRSRVLAEK